MVMACLRDDLVVCSNDLLCPIGRVCDDVHASCITPGQAEACVGLTDETPCSVDGIFGYCLDQICVDPGCGNGLLEKGELCDDGNRASGDGCDDMCRSLERCGDGVDDASRGEQCDDGNSISLDGCDSQCITEVETWATAPVSPASGSSPAASGSVMGRRMFYDRTRGTITTIVDGYLWTWNGATWTGTPGAPPEQDQIHDVVFDATRGTVLVISAAYDELAATVVRNSLSEWDGTAWQSVALANSPNLLPYLFRATYDSVRKRVVAVGVTAAGAGQLWSLDVAAARWTQLAAPPGFTTLTSSLDAAFDAARGVLVVTRDVPAATLEWNGTSWTSHAAVPAGQGGWSLAFDGARIVAVGGDPVADVLLHAFWNGTTWTARATTPGRRLEPQVAYDVARQRLVVYSEARRPLIEWTGTAWSVRATHPRSGEPMHCSHDPRGVLCTQSFQPDRSSPPVWDLWLYASAGSWSTLPVPASLQGLDSFTLTYDPVRRASVAVGNGELHLLGGGGWTTQPSSITLQIHGLTFDPRRQLLVGILYDPMMATSDLVAINAAGDAAMIGPPGYHLGVAFDARRNALVLGGTIGHLDETPTGWIPAVSPGVSPLVANQRRGSIETTTGDSRMWERLDGDWIHRGSSSLNIGDAVYDAGRGALVVLHMATYGSLFVRTRTYASTTPLETCTPGADADGDGLEHCADLDCWLECTPTCPPYAVCPAL